MKLTNKSRDDEEYRKKYMDQPHWVQDKKVKERRNVFAVRMIWRWQSQLGRISSLHPHGGHVPPLLGCP
jgi:hypothetical protein